MNPDVTSRYHSPFATAGANSAQSAWRPVALRLPVCADSSRNTMTFATMSIFVTGKVAPRSWRFTRSVRGGAASFTHCQHCEPTDASRRQSGHAGRPQRVQWRAVSRSLWWKQVSIVVMGTGATFAHPAPFPAHGRPRPSPGLLAPEPPQVLRESDDRRCDPHLHVDRDHALAGHDHGIE